MANRISHIDTRVFDYFNQRIHSKRLDFIMKLTTHLGGATATILLPVSFLIIGRHKASIGAHALIAVAFSHLLVRILKAWVNRPRPFLVNPSTNLICKPLEDFSFPSGHSAAAFSVATVLAMSLGPYAPVALLIAIMVGISRIYLGLHYPSDVLVGCMLGTLAAVLTHAFF